MTTIEWCHRQLSDGTVIPGYTFNLVWGCQKVSEGCKHCYADTLASRYGFHVWGPQAQRRTFGASYWQRPLLWNKAAQRLGHRANVFCCSMADVFEDHSTVEQERHKLWPLIEQTPWLNWLLLTKRPESILSIAPWGSSWPDNVWAGTSVENQRRAQERIPLLLEVPAAVRFLSCEPLLAPLDLQPWLSGLHWVICGGESGSGARPMAPQWPRDLLMQCRQAGVRYFFKQWGGSHHNAGGRILDGQLYSEMPDEVPVSSAKRASLHRVEKALPQTERNR